MQTIQKKHFKIIGISVKTTNENMQAAKDIPELWGKFMTEKILEKIPNRINEDIFCMYTDYDSDYKGAYKTIIGCEVSSLEVIPEGMITKEIDKGTYVKQTVNGILQDNIVYNKWLEIWNSDINRNYTADFEIYKKDTIKNQHGEVDIYISSK